MDFRLRESKLAPIAQLLAVFAAYVITARLGLLLVLPGAKAPAFWLPAGIALGSTLLLGLRIWPAIAAGALVTNVLALTGLGFAPQAVLGVALATTLGQTLEALVGAALVRRMMHGRDPLARPADTVRFILLGAGAAATISATIGMECLPLLGNVTDHAGRAWTTWWLGDTVGVLAGAPLLLAWRGRSREWPARRMLEMLVLLALMGAFVWSSTQLGAMGRFFFIPLLLWAGTRFGRFECAIVALLFASGYTIAIGNAPPGLIALPALAELLNHAGYIAIILATLLVLASLMEQLKESQAATKSSEERFRNLFEMHHSIMLVTDPVRGLIVDANPAAAAYYGYPRDVFRGMSIANLSTLPAPALEDDLGRITRGELTEFVATHRQASGEVRRVELRTSRVSLGDRNTFLSIITDVTERERAERVHELLAAIVGSSDDAIISKDIEGRVLSWNAGAERIYGYTEAEMLGQSIAATVPPGRREEHVRIMEDLRAGRGVHRLETERLCKDGRTIAVSITLSPLRDSAGRVFGASTITRDVTERNALTEQLIHSQKLESLGTLAGGVAHDFNNILTAIIGYTELMKMDMCAECPIQTSLAPIESASEQARRLTGSLLAFSRRQVMSPKPVRVNDLVTAAAGLLGRLIGEHIELVLALDPANPTVRVDGGQIDQVMMNLATNARDAMPGGGTITIGTRLSEADPAVPERRRGEARGRVRITISDTGSGIDEAVRDRIFEPFFTTKDRGKGTGLGLSIAYGVVEQHGGTLRLETHDGPGTTFCINLPAIDPVESSALAAEAAPLPRGEECILLVEDNSEVRGLGRRILERHGYRILEAADGQEAIEMLEERAAGIDLVLSDVVMPRRSGRDVLEAASRLRPGLPVILTSGYVDEAVPMEWIHRAGREFLPKPSTPAQLLCKVRETLDRRP